MAHAEQQSVQAIQIIFSSRTTLRKFLMKVKERPGMMEVKGVVYFIPCAECSTTYIGETGRTLKVHMAEHRRAVENRDHAQEWNCYACPKHCTHHQLARSKDPCEGGQLEEIGS